MSMMGKKDGETIGDRRAASRAIRTFARRLAQDRLRGCFSAYQRLVAEQVRAALW